MTTAAQLADDLVGFVLARLDELVEHHAPGLTLPRVFGGHLVDADAHADLAFVLGLVHELGHPTVAGVDVAPVALATLEGLVPERTEAFASYRAAETLARLGAHPDAEQVPGLTPERLEALAPTVQTPSTIDAVRAGQRPANYSVVVARCLVANRRLGLLEDQADLDEFLDRCRGIFSGTTTGWIDDGGGHLVHYDIYTPDVYLFAEPFADELEPHWGEGFARVIDDLADLARPGGAVVWGRSTGVLSMAMTIELAGMAAGRGLGADAGAWLARADETLRALDDWFSTGVVRAHQHRATMSYRGPFRRLQLTLDVLGKLVQAAVELRRAPHVGAAEASGAWPPVDRLIRFDPESTASVWTHRSGSVDAVIPLVAGWSTDYLPAPRSPGLFDCPTEGLPANLPVVHIDGRPLVPCGLPTVVEHTPGRLVIEHRRWAPVAAAASDASAVEGRRRAVITVQGRRLVVDEQLELELDPSVVGAVSLSIGERSDRPLDVAVDTTHPCRASTVDVDGIAEWRSFWGPLTTVHQIDLEPASQIEFRWSVTARLRVGSTIHGHPYDRGLYEALGPRVVDLAAGPDRADDVVAMRGLDVFHQHWPEWYSGDDPARAEATVATIRAAGIPLVWTQHNLLPHFTKEAGRDAYRVWAAAADAVIHHSHWGRDVALATYDYADDCVHEVVPHGHWGFRFDPHRDLDRATIEAMMGWEPAPIRLAVVGMPRAEKDIQLVLDAVAAVDRDDLQLVVRVGPDDVVPDDPRIVVETRHLDEAAYYRRLLAVDALVLPFASDGMLTTGTAFDALGGPLAVIASDWPFLAETFGDAALVYGHDREGLIELLTGLTPEALDASREAVARRAPAHDWGPIADRTLALFERLAGD